MNTKLIVMAIAICLLASCAPTALSTSSVTPAMEIETEAKATVTTPTPMPTAISTETVSEAKLFRSEDLPVKNWPDLEQYYACNDAERKADKWYYTNLSLPLIEEYTLLHSGDWTVSRQGNGYALSITAYEFAFEVRSKNYTVEVPERSGVYKINFTTKNCESDWLYVILPRDRDPLDFKVIVTIQSQSSDSQIYPNDNVAPEPFISDQTAKEQAETQSSDCAYKYIVNQYGKVICDIPRFADISMPNDVQSFYMWDGDFSKWQSQALQTWSTFDINIQEVLIICPNEQYPLTLESFAKISTPPCDHGVIAYK